MIKKVVQKLNFDVISFQWKKKVLRRLKWKTINALTCLVMKMGWVFLFMSQIKHVETIDLLLLTDDDRQSKNWIPPSLFQLSHKKSNKSKI